MLELDFAVSNRPCRDTKHMLQCVQSGRRVSLSLAELDQRARCVGRHLRDSGLRPGERLGIVARNGLEWILLDLAALKCGIKVAGFDPLGGWERFDLQRTYGLARLYTDHPDAYPGSLDIQEVATLPFDAADLEDVRFRYRTEDTLAVKFTSGSTGLAKGLEATAGSVVDSLVATQRMFNHRDGDNLLVFLPLSLLQQRYWVYSALTYGHDVTVTSFEYAFAAARMHQPTVVMGVPGFYEAVREQTVRRHPEARESLTARKRGIEELLGSRIRYLWTGSAPASREVLAFFNDCGVSLYEGYGMNETCIVSKNHPGAHRVGSVGKVLPNKRAYLDERGVLVVGSDHPVHTRYAHCAPGDNERMFLPNGDVVTGDLARFDEDGYLYILGRADEVVVLSNGKNVHVRPIEDAVRRSELVGECVVCGSGRAALGLVVSPARPSADQAGIRRYIEALNETLSKESKILRVLVVDRPFSQEDGLLTSQCKVRRSAIVARYEPQLFAN